MTTAARKELIGCRVGKELHWVHITRTPIDSLNDDIYGETPNRDIITVLSIATPQGLVDVIAPKYIGTKRRNADHDGFAAVLLPSGEFSALPYDCITAGPAPGSNVTMSYTGCDAEQATGANSHLFFGNRSLGTSVGLTIGSQFTIGTVVLYQCRITGNYVSPDLKAHRIQCRKRGMPFANLTEDAAMCRWARALQGKRQELQTKLRNRNGNINILILGLIGTGKSSYINEVFDVLTGVYIEHESTDHLETHVTTSYQRRHCRLFPNLFFHTLEGLNPSDTVENIARHKARISAVMDGRLENGSFMETMPMLTDPSVAEYKVNAGLIILGPTNSKRVMEMAYEFRNIFSAKGLDYMVVLNKCDTIGDFEDLSIIEDPFDVTACDAVAERVQQLRKPSPEGIGIGASDIVLNMCPHKCNAIEQVRNYFALLIADTVLKIVSKVEGREIVS